MAQNLVIGGVTYNGVENMEMINSKGEKIVYVEKFSTGNGEYVVRVGGKSFYTVEEALANAAPGDTITMLADATEAVNLIIPEGVTLDLQSYTLTADSVTGMDGSFLTATPNSGKLNVPQGNIILSEQGWRNASGQYVLPIWDPVNGYYLFSLFAVNTATAARGLWIDEKSKTLRFQFKHQATGAINQTLLKDGASDNELAVKVVLEWDDGKGGASLEYAFSDEQVGGVTGSRDYLYSVYYPGLKIDLDTFAIYGVIESNSGAIAVGDKWTLENAKRDETIVPVAQIGEQIFYTVEDALVAAAPGDTITLTADTTENATITIPSGVTLDLRGYTLTADRVIGLDGSFLNATCPSSTGTGGGKLIVPKGNLTLSEESFVDSANYNILPVWTGSEYIFSRLVTNNNKVVGDKLKVTDDSIFFQFGYNATSYVKKTYFADGFSDNALSMIVRISWKTFDGNGEYQGIATQDFAYSDIQVGKATNNASLVYELTNYKSLGIDIEKGNVKISGMIITDSGAVAHNVEMAVTK